MFAQSPSLIRRLAAAFGVGVIVAIIIGEVRP